MTNFGYARVSTSNQSLDIQIQKLEESGVSNERIFSDKKSGKNNDRDGLEKLCEALKATHTAKIEDVHLYVCKMDRLGRSTLHMLELIEQFKEWGVTVHFLDDGLSSDNAHAQMVMTILSAVATAERQRILERTNEGRIDAMARGVKFGAKKKIDDSKIRQMKGDGVGVTAIAKELDISRVSVYRALKG